MGWVTLAGQVPANVGTSGFALAVAGSPLSDTMLNKGLMDALLSVLYSLPTGVLSGGVCTVSGRVVTIPTDTYFFAGPIWHNDADATVTVPDDATTYIWGCADGEIRMTSTTTPPTSYTSRTACIIVKAVAASGTATLDHTVQQKARFYDPAAGTIKEGKLLLDVVNGKVMGNSSPVNNSKTSKALSDADYALSASEYSHYIIEFTGALTADRTITLPNVSGARYIMVNKTTGGHALLFKVSGESTAVSVAAGDAQAIYGDGTNYAMGSGAQTTVASDPEV